MSLRTLYHRSPTALQNVAATGYGLRELSRRYSGSFRSELAGFERREWWSPERLEEDQARRLQEMVRHCVKSVPYYRQLFRDLDLDEQDIKSASDLDVLPILDKETVRSSPSSFMPIPRPPHLLRQSTGGTTGTPLSYVATRRAVQFNYAAYEARARRWAGVRFGDRIATFQGQPIVDGADWSGPFWRRNLAFNQLYFSVYHLTAATLPAYVVALEQFRPRVIVGYTSAVHRVARFLLDTGDVGRVTPNVVMVSSETVFPAVRADLSLAFGAPVRNAYSLGELVAFVSECPCGEMHVSTDYGVLELVPGGAGLEIVATGLFNEGMPLLRYRTGDTSERGQGSPSCGRGLPLVGTITGRTDDVVHTPEGAQVGPAPMSLAFQLVRNLRKAQVHQDDPGSATILCETTAEFDAEDKGLLEMELRKRLGPTIKLSFSQVDQIPRTLGGKERLVVSKI